MSDLAIDHLQRAVAALRNGKLDHAERLFKEILSKHPQHVAALNLIGVTLTQIGKYQDAEGYLRRALQVDSSSDATFYNYGIVLKALRRPADALKQFSQALALNPAVAETWNNRGTVLHDLKRYGDAVADFERATVMNASYADAFFNKGRALAALGRHQQSLAAYERALTLKPDFKEAWLGRGNTLADIEQFDDALSAYDRALALEPRLARAWLGRGNVLFRTSQFAEAAAAYEKAIGLSPDFAEAWAGRGIALNELKRYDEAASAFDKALSLNPNLAEALVGRALLLSGLRRYDDALADCERALSLEPGFAPAWIARGNALNALHRVEEAIAAHDRAIALKPDSKFAWLCRGDALTNAQQPGAALEAFDRVIALDPGSVEAWKGRASVLAELNRTDEALESFDKALSIDPSHARSISNRIYLLDFVASSGFAGQQRARDYWWEKVGAPLAERWSRPRANVRDPNRKIKVGYVSADLRAHSAALSFKPLILNHNKADFHVTCYSSTVVSDSTTREFELGVDQWRDVVQISDERLFDLICEDQIDILVDLSGHTAGHRLEVFARKPAPVQISVGATGTGLRTIDYIFADPVICPPEVRHLFAEKIFDLPSIMTIDALPEQLEVAPAPVLSKGYITFGIFNRISKISDEAISVWSRIIQAVPGSRLMLKHYALDDPAVRIRQLERFGSHGIGSERIDLAGSSPRTDHLAAFKDVDISLDPFPHNGGISTLDSLQMGVPVVALLGNAPTSRAAGSILCSAGLESWVAQSIDEYFAIATTFAAMPDYLARLRYDLPRMLASSAVGNGAAYARAVGAAYRQIWMDYCQNGLSGGSP